VQALGERQDLWLRLEELLSELRCAREEAYFDLGFEHGFAAGQTRGARAKVRSSQVVETLATRLQERVLQEDLPRHERMLPLLLAALAFCTKAEWFRGRRRKDGQVRRTAGVRRDLR
jgi:hypothetical protein